MGRVALVTGVSRDLGRRFARCLAATDGIDRVIGVDVVPPRGDVGAMSFIRADIRTPVIAKVIAKEDVDTVVHMSVIATPGSAGGRGTMKELNVIGTMQLLAACQKAPSVQHLVVKSTSTVYGASSRDPAMFTEEMGPRRNPRSGFSKDAAEIEGYVRGFARRRPDVRVTMLRLANVVGPHVVSPMTSYFRLPVVPTVLGYDARMQFVHQDDLDRVLRHAVARRHPGHVQHRRRRLPDAVAGAAPAAARDGARCPASPSGSSARCCARRGSPTSRPSSSSFLTFGRGIDTTRMRTELGFEPEYTTAEAFADFASSMPASSRISERAVAGLADLLPDDRGPVGASRG